MTADHWPTAQDLKGYSQEPKRKNRVCTAPKPLLQGDNLIAWECRPASKISEKAMLPYLRRLVNSTI